MTAGLSLWRQYPDDYPWPRRQRVNHRQANQTPTGTTDEQLAVFRVVRDQLAELIDAFVAEQR